MRVVAGRFGGRRLEAPPGDATRPTTDRVREALFGLVGARRRVAGAAVLDLFAGSGALAFEALSRGAERAVLVERHAPALAVARRNAQALGVEAACAFVRADALAWLARPPAEAFALVLADPPYGLPALAGLPALVGPHLAPDGLLALEHDARHTFEAAPGFLTSRAYGRTVVSLFDRADPPPAP